MENISKCQHQRKRMIESLKKKRIMNTVAKEAATYYQITDLENKLYSCTNEEKKNNIEKQIQQKKIYLKRKFFVSQFNRRPYAKDDYGRKPVQIIQDYDFALI